MKSLRDYNIDFMGVRRSAIAISVALVLLSIGSLVFQGLNWGLDFTGGTLVEVTFPSAAAPDAVRTALEADGFVNGVVQNFGTERDLLIRMPPQEGRDAALTGNAVFEALQRDFPGVELRRSEFVGPAVGEELRETGGVAMIVSLVAVMIYIMFRFTTKFAVGGIVALAHDAILTVGAFSLFRWTFDLTGLAAVLAIIGFSINDTIVIFDRIRENFRAMRRATPEETINVSINQTLDRTISTSFTVMLVLIALAALGGDVVHGFALALIVGVVAGVYSSVYIAANLLVILGMTREDLLVPEKEKESSVP
jgi:preprotein translocase subunit SecF